MQLWNFQVVQDALSVAQFVKPAFENALKCLETQQY